MAVTMSPSPASAFVPAGDSISKPSVSTLGKRISKPESRQGRQMFSTKDISGIVAGAGFAEQGHEFLLKTPLTMVLGLTADVVGDHILL